MVELKTIAINVTVLLMFLNAAPGVLVASGTAADLGITPSVGGDEAINEANENIRNVEASGGFGDTLFGLYTTVTGPIRAVLGIVAGGPIMLISAGVPGFIVDFIFVPQYLIVGATIIYVLAGRLL